MKFCLTFTACYQSESRCQPDLYRTPAIADNVSALAAVFEARSDARLVSHLWVYVLGIGGAGQHLLIVCNDPVNAPASGRNRPRRTTRTKPRLLRLLDEIADLADGDLTAQAT